MEEYISEDLEKIYKEQEKNKDNNDTINELSARQQARDKLPVWYGSRDNYYHGLREVLNNAVDEISNNFDSGKITVFVEDDMQTISVIDTGRGIPIHKSTNGVPNYELLFERFFTSTNYNNADTGKISSGTNGVGTVVLNHTSSIFSVTTRLPEGAWNVTYTDGANECTGLTTLQADTVEGSYGTTVKFRLDPTMYTNSTYKMDEILNIVKHISATSNTIEFEVCEHGEEGIIRHEFNYTSLKDYFEKETQMLTSKVLTGARTEREDEVEVQYGVRVKERNAIEAVIATSAEVVQETYLNYNWLKDNGTILEGIIQGIRSYMNAYAKENKLFPKSVKQFALSDIETSFSIMASIHGSNMEFANQTKFSTDKKLYRTIAMQKAKDMLEIHQVEDPESFSKMVKHLLLVQKNNESSRKATSKLKKQLSENVNTIDNRVEGLVDCVNHGKEAELFIVEGKSALGSIAMARDAKFQAVYPLRGKILNCRKSSLEDILSNDIILDMVKALGCGIETDSKKKLDLPPFDIEKLRYGKIVVACFTGDTTVKMADGTLKTFEELTTLADGNPDKAFPIYSVDSKGHTVITNAKNPRVTGTTKELYEVTLDDGQTFKCTPEHMWMDRNGNYVMAKDLYEGQSMMPLYTKKNTRTFNKGRELVKDNVTGDYEFTHMLSYDSYNTDRKDVTGNLVKGKQIHHVDENFLNNDPTNLMLLDTEIHKTISDYASSERTSKLVEMGVLELKTWAETFNGTKEQKEMLSRKWQEGIYDKATWKHTYNGSDKHLEDLKEARERGAYEGSSYFNEFNGTDEQRAIVAKRNSDKKVINNIKRNRVLRSVKFLMNNNMEINEENWNDFKHYGTVPFNRITEVFDTIEDLILYVNANLNSIEIGDYKAQWEIKAKNQYMTEEPVIKFNREDYDYNHKISSVKRIVLEEEVDVYCMTVEDNHNFAISTDNNSGVFVKNCDADADGEQIIVLVLTMFEALMPKLLENGYVFIVRTPLYEIHFKDDTVDYIFNEAEKEEKIKTIDSLNKAYKIARLKGLGEMDTEVMAETAMNVETRNLVSIGYNNLDDIEDKFETWMGKKVDKRKSIIETQLDKFVNGDI